MLDTLFWIAVGAFVGWNFPQPAYARWFQEWVVSQWNKLTNKTQ
jgi:hypothetical protein